MATQQTATIGIIVDDKGSTRKHIKSAKELKSAYEGAADAAARVGTPGSRAVAAAAAPGGRPVQDYGTQRGSAGMTGASARDFANQAQGLGGIVRLYATYAANVFAVGAAYRALSAAMDTTNMVRGLDQLGAASGVALGSLAKRLVDATDGAISLREAMEATTKAASSGMSSDSILRMGKVAKQASQALGVDMADAVSRISRGITKLEPELLDEIGIFTRIDPAVNAYAKSVGKSASALTDFERRMAFANAVLAEGEQKFGEIDIDTNPYSKLLATLKDVTQAGLELVNKFLVPVIGYLAQSPTALAVAIAGLASVLIKQAIPAFGQFKEGLAASAAAALEVSQRKASDAVDALKKLRQVDLIDLEDKLQSQIEAVGKAEDKMRQLRTKPIRSNTSLGRVTNEATAVEDITAKDLANVDRQAALLRKNAASASEDIAKALNAEADSYTKLTSEIRKAQAIREEEIRLQNSAITSTEAARIGYSNLALTLQASLKAQEAATKKSIISNAAYNASLIGPIGAFRLMKEEIKKAELNLNAFSKATLYARGALAMLAGTIGTIIGALGGFMMVIGTLTAAFTILDGFFSKNGKQMKEFDDNIDRSNSSVDTLRATLDKISSKPFGEQFSASSLVARATAFDEVTQSVVSLSKSFEAVNKATESSVWDSAINSIKKLWGGDNATQFASNLTTTLSDALTLVEDGPEGENLRKQLSKVLSIDPKSLESGMAEALQKLAEEADPKKLKDLEKVLLSVGMAAKVSANSVQELTDSFKTTADAYKTFANEFKVKNTFTGLGEAIVNTSSKIADAFKTPEAAIKQLSDIASNVDFFKLLGTEDQQTMLKFRDSIVDTNIALNRSAEEVKKAKDQYKELFAIQQQLQAKATVKATGVVFMNPELAAAIDRVNKARSMLSAQEARFAKDRAESQALIAKFPNLAFNQFSKGANLIQTSIEQAFAKGGSQLANAALDVLGDVPGVAEERNKLMQLELKLQMELLKAQRDLVAETQVNTATMRLEMAKKDRDAAIIAFGEGRSRAGRAPLDAAEKEVAAAEDYLRISQLGKEGTPKALKEVVDIIKNGSQELQRASGDMLQYIQQVAGFEKQLRSLKDTSAKEAFQTKIKEISNELKVKKEYNKEQQKTNDLEIDTIRQKVLARTLSAEDAALQTLEVEKANVRLDFETKSLEIQARRDAIAQSLVAGVNADLAISELLLLNEKDVNNEKEKQNKLISLGLATDKEIREIKAAELKLVLDIYQIMQDTIALNDELIYANTEANILEQERKGASSGSLKAAKAELDVLKVRNKLNADKEKLGAKLILDTQSANNIADPTSRQNTIEALKKKYGIEIKLLERVAELKTQDILREAKITERQKAYADIFEQTIDRMADAIAEFAQTGKLDFKSLIDSMLADLLRYEMRAQYTSLYKSMGGASGIMNMVIGAFTGGSAPGVDASGYIDVLGLNAKGNAYDSNGIQKFAKGGTFTNSVVSSPTLFKFAQGTGLMGEAGPEAIMPLKRDNSGNLGVRATAPQSNVNVTVINNSSEKAETRETMDSRGNRSIEVVIGDMVAGEMSRPNSALQNSMKNTYGNTPVLIRR